MTMAVILGVQFLTLAMEVCRGLEPTDPCILVRETAVSTHSAFPKALTSQKIDEAPGTFPTIKGAHSLVLLTSSLPIFLSLRIDPTSLLRKAPQTVENAFLLLGELGLKGGRGSGRSFLFSEAPKSA
jgi:hypothetical protein